MFRHYPLSLCCIALIWVLCLMPSPEIGTKPPVGFDKLVHTVMYLGTCSVIWWEHLRTGACPWRRTALLTVVLPIAMSGIIELVQEYATSTRSGDWWDFAANAAGVLLAVPVGRFLLPALHTIRDGKGNGCLRKNNRKKTEN